LAGAIVGLLYGLDTKLARSLALLASLPTMLIAFSLNSRNRGVCPSNGAA
jgi:ABC-type uncharacterized transport system permease subunit